MLPYGGCIGTMTTMFCVLCRRPVEARRHIGIGTVLLAFCTGGLSLLAIPFYSRRCPICTGSALEPLQLGTGENAQLMSPEAIAEMEQRLRTTEAELEATTTELDRVRTELDFYRQLIGDPAKRQEGRTGEP